ncbi:hypothetical protein COCSUDRAFT_62465 [Coccomyxa subellipsoidea C-169]|uniref:Uncharacterized protein n=1 Tax=Coccomyxa subellipsoidea (strain C-169) TaxID=574566 RepID=I0YZW8_COCSC|nr:hypothetical protein COCSUDRAFT_62465 [Coccomyxa subellipsoidea C-169]EIE23937.1 hypothetical protein COCSUDRAFT_62465 [Coccomyxa subellipsoidea C-169]|eukprot:XP_005648481.1 hypothetical protein COCSUDRAFT_62465 [Coccomyxa subellipsoidea C-169]
MKTERAPMTCAVAAVSLLYAYVGSLATDLREVIRGRTRLSPLALALIVGVSAALIGVAAALLTTYTRRQLRRRLEEESSSNQCDEEHGEARQPSEQDPLM